MTDHELLKLAAKAANIKIDWRDSVKCFCHSGSPYNIAWDPLNDYADAFSLAVELELIVMYSKFSGEAEVWWNRGSSRFIEYGPDNPCATTCRAIVSAAAEIGNFL